MDHGFRTMRLPDECDAIAPDGSRVRVLLGLAHGSMAHFELAAGRVSRPVAHHRVAEIWYILGGGGEMWRRHGDKEQTVPLAAGTCLSIPAGTHFQFRSSRHGPLTVVAVTMPPWPAANDRLCGHARGGQRAHDHEGDAIRSAGPMGTASFVATTDSLPTAVSSGSAGLCGREAAGLAELAGERVRSAHPPRIGH